MPPLPANIVGLVAAVVVGWNEMCDADVNELRIAVVWWSAVTWNPVDERPVHAAVIDRNSRPPAKRIGVSGRSTDNCLTNLI